MSPSTRCPLASNSVADDSGVAFRACTFTTLSGQAFTALRFFFAPVRLLPTQQHTVALLMSSASAICRCVQPAFCRSRAKATRSRLSGAV